MNFFIACKKYFLVSIIVLITIMSASSAAKGDVNNDSQVNIVDALVIAQYTVGLVSSIDTVAADVDCNSSVSIVDALLVAQYSVGAISAFPCPTTTPTKTATATPTSTPTTPPTTDLKFFVGNVIGNSVPSNYANYWNQISPENAGKWGSVEGTRDQMNWSGLDMIYNYATSKNFIFKQHCFVWGSQYPSWAPSIGSEVKGEVEEYMSLFATRYPNVKLIDVVNEPLKTQCPFKDGLGGAGSTGYDWIVWSFQTARKYFPNAKLLINEYGTENDPNARSQYINMIKVLQSKGLIDAIGIQCHYFNLDSMNASQMKTCLDDYAKLGLPIYATELDIKGGGSDQGQLSKYQELFPVLYQHASVRGITLWGYVNGQTWSSGTDLTTSSGGERPALTWIKNYIQQNPKN